MSSGRSIILVLSAVITHGTTDPPTYGSIGDSQYENEMTLMPHITPSSQNNNRQPFLKE